MENVNKALDELIASVKESSDYKKCLSIKKRMSENSELMELIANIKVLQKKYIRSNYAKEIKEELDKETNKLEAIPIYIEYEKYLELVNEKIDYIKDWLNNYFNNILN